MTKKVRIKAWQETGDSAINMADRLGPQGRQKLKMYFAGPSVFYALEGHWHHQEWGQTCPKISFHPLFLKFFVKKHDFLPLARFFFSPENHVFFVVFGRFLIIGMLFFS
jgi:hypothetical protein